MGWTLVHFLWQGAVIAALLWLALRLLARRSPQARYLVACLALLLIVAAPVATFFLVQPESHTPIKPSQAASADYPEDDTWGKGDLKVPPEFLNGTATLEQAKAWCRALVVGSCFGDGKTIEVEERELVPGGEKALVVFDPSSGGSGGRAGCGLRNCLRSLAETHAAGRAYPTAPLILLAAERPRGKISAFLDQQALESGIGCDV